MESLRDQVVRFSFENQLTHVPSALSMIDYLHVLFSKEHIMPYRDNIVLGKPFGSQAYYILWERLGYLNDVASLSLGVKHDEIDFVTFSEETMGNALGVGCGIAMGSNKKTWVNLSDASLQMGSVLESIQYIGHNKINNMIVTIDNNNCQVTGKTSDIIDITPVMNLFKDYNWDVSSIDGHDVNSIHSHMCQLSYDRPVCVFMNTVKGCGVDYMEADPIKWHYKPIGTL